MLIRLTTRSTLRTACSYPATARWASNDAPKPAPSSDAKESATSKSSISNDPPAPKKKTRAQLEAEYVERFEERFGGAAQTQLGELMDGKPQGQARNVQRNMFRLI